MPGEGSCDAGGMKTRSTTIPGDKLIIRVGETIAAHETPQERTLRHVLFPVVEVESAPPKVPVLDGRTFPPLEGDWTSVMSQR